MALGATFGEMIYPDATEDYLSGFKGTDTYGFPREYADRPAAGTEQMLDLIAEQIHNIEVGRKLVESKVSVLAQMLREHPESIERLTPERQAQVYDLANRLAAPIVS